MPNLDDHMDDLFRAAADNYRLKDDDSQWDKISAVLNNKPITSAAPHPQNNKGRNTYLFLLFLLCLLVTGGVLLLPYNKKAPTTHISIQSDLAYPPSIVLQPTINEKTADHYPINTTNNRNKKSDKNRL